MAITYTTIEKIAGTKWRYAWTGTAPFYIFLNGENLTPTGTTDTEWITDIPGWENEPPPLEVMEEATYTAKTSQNQTNPARIILQWFGSTSAAYYDVEEYIGGEWTFAARIQETGQGYYQYETPPLADVTAAVWRVTAVDTYENESTAISFTVNVVRNPPVKGVLYTYASGTTTISGSADPSGDPPL